MIFNPDYVPNLKYSTNEANQKQNKVDGWSFVITKNQKT